MNHLRETFKVSWRGIVKDNEIKINDIVRILTKYMKNRQHATMKNLRYDKVSILTSASCALFNPGLV